MMSLPKEYSTQKRRNKRSPVEAKQLYDSNHIPHTGYLIIQFNHHTKAEDEMKKKIENQHSNPK